MSEKTWTTMHVHLDIKHFLTKPDKELTGLLCNAETQEALTADQVREFLTSELRKGYDYFCGCDNRNADGSCAGHPLDGPLVEDKKTEGQGK